MLTEGGSVADKQVDWALERRQWLKRVRSEIRLKHADRADREIYMKLPAAEKMFDDALAKAQGKRFELDTGSVVEGEE